MSNGYIPLVDSERARGAWEKDKGRWQRYLAAKYAKKSLKAGLKSAVNNVTFRVGAVIFEAPALYKTHRHIARLEELRVRYGCENHIDDVDCNTLLTYVIEQKRKKRESLAKGAVPVLGTAESARRAVHAARKPERGGERDAKAHLLHSRIKAECPMAQAIVAEICGGDYREQTAWEKMFAIAHWIEGKKVIKDKLAS